MQIFRAACEDLYNDGEEVKEDDDNVVAVIYDDIGVLATEESEEMDLENLQLARGNQLRVELTR